MNDDDIVKICQLMRTYGIEKLKAIIISYNEMTSKGASLLFDTLRECNSVLCHINLSYNQFDDKCMKDLGEFIECDHFLERLTISGYEETGLGYEDKKRENNGVTDKGVEILSEYLIGNTSLIHLELDGNKGITAASIPLFIEIVKKSCIIGMKVSINWDNHLQFSEAISTPIEEREIPIKSKAKSAAKISTSTY